MDLDLLLYTVAVHDLEAAATQYKALFGMQEVGERFHNPIGNFDVIPMGYGDHRVLNLIHPSADDAPLARLMKERANPANPHGEGIYMVAFETDDPEGFAANVEAAGGRITRRPDQSPFVWVHPTSSNFVFMEVRPRRSE